MEQEDDRSLSNDDKVISVNEFKLFEEAVRRSCYRALLEREPEPEVLNDMQMPFLSLDHEQAIQSIIRQFYLSEELELKDRHKYRQSVLSPYGIMQEKVVCFIHLEKTGGTSLAALLGKLFQEHEIFDQRGHHPRLSCMIPEEICRFRFFHGHFDYFDSCFIHAKALLRICIFRDPIERLISFYNYHKAHDPEEGTNNPFVALAQMLDPEAFFSHSSVKENCRVNNYYLHALGDTVFRDAMTEISEMSAAFRQAWKRIAKLDVVGLTHRMEDSVEILRRITKLPVANEIFRYNSTEDVARQSKQIIEKVDLTPELEELLNELTFYDRKLYAMAKSRFDFLLSRA